jgi:hypothetical protein
MLRLAGGQVESLFDELLPAQVRELPADLAALDRLLTDARLLAPIQQEWHQTACTHGRPTTPMAASCGSWSSSSVVLVGVAGFEPATSAV